MLNYSAIDMLKDYQLNKSKLKLLGYKNNSDNQELLELKNEMDLLDYCITCLPDEDKEIITNIYIKKQSMRQMSKMLIMARSSIVRKRDKAVNLLENLLKSVKN